MKGIRFLILTIGILAYFIFSSGWYEPVTMKVEGKAEPGAVFDLMWDSGGGYNKYEKRVYRLTPLRSREQHTIKVIIRHLGSKHFASQSTDIVCRAVRVDGIEVAPEAYNLAKGGQRTGEGIRLTRAGAEVSLQVEPEGSVEVEMLTNTGSGKVELVVGGVSQQHDLYMANVEAKSKRFPFWTVQEDGGFVVTFTIPRYEIDTFRLRVDERYGKVAFARIHLIQDGETLLYQSDDPTAASKTLLVKDRRHKTYFHPWQLSLQTLFALLTVWIIFAFNGFVEKRGGLVGLFTGRRKRFWWFFGGALFMYLFWLAVFWPGVMSVDSLKIWRAAVLPDVFVDNHPPFNILYYMYLAQFWQNPAVVPLFHVICMATLIGFVFYRVSARGVHLGLLLPFYVLLIFSLPIGLYNIVLWKDIPFAMLVVLWAYTLAELWYQKRADQYYMSWQKGLALTLLLFALALTRYNGTVYLVVVPFYFGILGLVDRRKFTIAVVVLTALAVIGGLVVQYGLGTGQMYVVDRAKWFLQAMFNTPFENLIMRTVKNFWGILDINQTVTKWDLWHYFLADRQAYWFLNHTGWSDIYPFLPEPGETLVRLRDFCMKIYHASYTVPWVYLSWNPVWALVLLPLSLLCFRKTPMSAIFSSFILIQVFVLLFVLGVMNWRYYYFVYLSVMVLPILILVDLRLKILSKKMVSKGDPV